VKRPATTIAIASFVVGAVIIGISGARLVLRDVPCGPGFTRHGARCCPTPPRKNGYGPGLCATEVVAACPLPLVPVPRGCDAPDPSIVDVPATKVTVGPSDWEAEGRVKPRTIETKAFRLDRFEVSIGRACKHAQAGLADRNFCRSSDPSRAAYGADILAAHRFCRAIGGRLPTEDEWIAAAAGDRPRRYPWGDTGAVCRRGAWGLATGPCGEGAKEPDTVGAHPDGVTPLGIHDLAGNVAEWVDTGTCPADGVMGGECIGVVRGGSFETALATDLRTWMRREVSGAATDTSIGFRCAYDAVR